MMVQLKFINGIYNNNFAQLLYKKDYFILKKIFSHQFLIILNFLLQFKLNNFFVRFFNSMNSFKILKYIILLYWY